MQIPEPDRFEESVRHVRAYTIGEPGAHSALMAAAHRDPEGMTVSLVALGAVLLDIAAGATGVSPDVMLDKVTAGVVAMAQGRSTSPLDDQA